MRADPLGKGKEWELDRWRQFEVFAPVKIGARAKDVADTRRALTRKEAEEKETAKARLVSEG